MLDFSLEGIATKLTYLCVFIIAGSIHEFAHASSAYELGDPTAKYNGRMTINPIAHIDPIGSILFPLIGAGIGWMKPVPVFLPNLKKPTADHAVIAFAGPFSNFVQACMAILIMKTLSSSVGIGETISYILQIYAYINIILMGFNLIPFPPLDGGAILKYFLPTSVHHIFESLGRFSFIILIILLISGAISTLLIPFREIFIFLMNSNIILLFFINAFNFLLISYFFRNSIKNKIYSNKRKKISKANVNKEIYNKAQTNNKYIDWAKNIISIIKEKGLLDKIEDKSIIEKVTSLRTKLDKNANICPPVDYNIEDNTCKECEWFKNCLVRHTDAHTE